MSAYSGPGFQCRVARACRLRVFPASGDRPDLLEAARMRNGHERRCSRRDRERSSAPQPFPRTADEHATVYAAAAVDVGADREAQQVAPTVDEDGYVPPAPPKAAHHRAPGAFHGTCEKCRRRWTAPVPRPIWCDDCRRRMGRRLVGAVAA